MLLEELVKQHRVYRVVAHGVGFVLLVTHYQIGIYFLYILRHKTKLSDGIRVNVFRVAEAYGFECENSFAPLFHGLYVSLEPPRGWGDTELVVAVDHDRRAGHCHSPYAGDEGPCVSDVSYADGAGFTSSTDTGNIDILTSRGEARASEKAQSDVVDAGRVARERGITVGCVLASGCVALERASTGGGVLLAGCVII